MGLNEARLRSCTVPVECGLDSHGHQNQKPMIGNQCLEKTCLEKNGLVIFQNQCLEKHINQNTLIDSLTFFCLWMTRTFFLMF